MQIHTEISILMSQKYIPVISQDHRDIHPGLFASEGLCWWKLCIGESPRMSTFLAVGKAEAEGRGLSHS